MTHNVSGERDLCASVLALAFEDATGNVMRRLPKLEKQQQYYLDRRNYIINDARAWFNSRRRDIGSFSWVSHVLDLEPIPIRKYINEHEPIQPDLPKVEKKGRPKKSCDL